MNLPNVSQAQIDAMIKKAEEKYPTQQEPEPEQPQQEEPSPQEEQPVEAETQEQDYPQEEAAPQKPTKEDNIRILRERSEKAERERDELLQHLQKLQQAPQTEKTQQKIEAIKDNLDDLSINPDDLAEGKHLIKLVNHIKNLEKRLEESSQRSQTTTAELKLKRDFPDFGTVASYDNLKRLRDADPDLADAILSTKDTYKQHALAYKMIKKLGIYREDTYSKEREIAQKNIAKPRPLSSISPQQGEGALSKANAFANGLTDELKKQLHKEMMQSIKNG